MAASIIGSVPNAYRLLLALGCSRQYGRQSHSIGHHGHHLAAGLGDLGRPPQYVSNMVHLSHDEREEMTEAPRGACWVPHPRTGIYFPKGQEEVLEDVPTGAASLQPTYWLRGVDGVDVDGAATGLA